MSIAPCVVLDACVLVPQSLCELCLRLGEAPELYRPIWSDEIIGEAHRALTVKLTKRWTSGRADRWVEALASAFPEAKVNPDPRQLPELRNDPKDRHVLATAIRAKSGTIVTFNLRDFRTEALSPWNVRAISPDEFLLELYQGNPATVSLRVMRLAQRRGSFDEFLRVLGRLAPRFVATLREDISVDDAKVEEAGKRLAISGSGE
jgi:predicted nucleic acid-binding protein